MALAELFAILLAGTPVPMSTPEGAAAEFVDAFKAMDEKRFDRCFAPDVTMFFPDGRFPTGKVEGRPAVLSAFHDFFKRARASGRATLAITPIGQRVERFGKIAIVSFTLDSGEDIGRRSIVLRKIGGEWRIAHFHASTVTR